MRSSSADISHFLLWLARFALWGVIIYVAFIFIVYPIIRLWDYLKTGYWQTQSVTSYIGWDNPTDWYGLWKILDDMNPFFLIVPIYIICFRLLDRVGKNLKEIKEKNDDVIPEVEA